MAARLGAQGGKVTSKAKAEAARANGKRGGRPKKRVATLRKILRASRPTHAAGELSVIPLRAPARLPATATAKRAAAMEATVGPKPLQAVRAARKAKTATPAKGKKAAVRGRRRTSAKRKQTKRRA